MIKSNELRIGNWVAIDDLPPEQITLEIFAILKNYLFHLSKFKPILLNHKILEKAGFEKDGDGVYVKSKCLYWLDKNENEGILQIAIGYSPLINCPCSYVHQLQNLIFSLTGEELEINL